MEFAVLGATGLVGQKMLQLIGERTDWHVKDVVASPTRVGQRLGSMISAPASVEDKTLRSWEEITAPYVLSALPASAALPIEKALAERGHHVVSNASAHRMDPAIPLIIPEVNGKQIALVDKQCTRGKIVTNPNCAAVVVALALHPILERGQVHHVHVVTLQAISGAGQSGLSSFDIANNIIPHIDGEVEKIERETQKILAPHSFSLTAQVTRVPILHGHTVALHIHSKEPIRVENLFTNRDLYCLHTQENAPQPRHLTDNDQRIHIGKIRQQGNYLSLIAIGHNLVRGAAGAALLNAELLRNHLEGST